MNNYDNLKDECCRANHELPTLGLVDLTWGNVSVMDRRAGVFAIKPSGVAYANLKREDMVVVDLEGKVVEGTLRFSSDTPTHRRLLGGPHSFPPRDFLRSGGLGYSLLWDHSCRPFFWRSSHHPAHDNQGNRR